MSEQVPERRSISRREALKLGGGALAAVTAAPLLSAYAPVKPRRHVHLNSEAKGHVTIWTQQTDIYLKAQQHIAEVFNAHHKVQVKVVPVPSTSVTDVSKLLTAVRGGTGPDAYFLDRFTVSQQAATGTIEPLDPFVSKEHDWAGHYLGYAWKEVLFKGKPYGIPFDTDVRGIYYNKTMLQQLGFNPSEFDISKGPMTVQRMHDINTAANQTGSNGNYTRVGIIPGDDGFSQGFGYTWGFIYGGKFANDSKCEVTPTNPGVVKGYQFLYDWAKEFGPQKLATWVSSYAPNKTTLPAAQDPFFSGKAAMEITGDWELAALQTYAPSLDFGITYLPVPKAGDNPATWSGGWSLVIPKGAKNPEGAWEAMKYMCGQPGQKYYTTKTVHLPTWKTLVKNKSLYNPNHAVFVEHFLPITQSRPPLPVGAKYWDELLSAEDQVNLNQQQAMPALKSVKNQVQPQLQHFCPLK